MYTFRGACYEYCVLPFSLSLNPSVFEQCTEAVIALLQCQGIHLATYLLLAMQYWQQAETHVCVLLRHLRDLGFVIKGEKSRFSPTQDMVSLGPALDSVSFTLRLSVEWEGSFRACLTLFQLDRTVPFSLCLELLGLMASTILVVWLGCLHMRDFQF